MKCIVAATDGSEAAGHAIDLAATLARTSDADLWIIHVAGGASDSSGEDVREYARCEHMRPGEALATVSEEELSSAGRLASGSGVRSVHTESPIGDPVDIIIRSALEKHADLIVVGADGRGRLTGLLLGSVSQKLVASAPCAVLVVP